MKLNAKQFTYLAVALFCILTNFSFGQNIFLFPDSVKSVVNLNSNNGLYADKIPYGLSSKFVFGGFIDDDIKNKGANNLSNENIIAGNSFSEISYLSSHRTTLGKNLFWGVKAGYNYDSFNQISKGFYNLTFFGNKPYAGKSLDFSNSKITLLNYSYLQFSLGKVFNIGKGVAFGQVDAGILLGHNYNQIDIEKGNIYTEEFGDYINLTMKGSVVVSDTNSYLATGFGGSVNLNFGYKDDKNKLFIQAKNIGVINWSNSINATIDTSMKFEGIVVSDIFSFSDSVISDISVDSLLKNNGSKKSNTLLPIDIQVNYQRTFNKIEGGLFAAYRINALYFPFIQLYGKYPFGPLKIGAYIGYGGYASIQPGLSAEYQTYKFKAQIGSYNLSTLANSNSSSLNLFIGIGYTLE